MIAQDYYKLWPQEKGAIETNVGFVFLKNDSDSVIEITASQDIKPLWKLYGTKIESVSCNGMLVVYNK